MSQEQSIAVLGGGLAGTCLAALLARHGWPVELFEAQALDQAPPPERDLRTLALAQSSWDTLATLGIHAAALDARPIGRIHVSFRGRAGSVLLDARECGQVAFGHTVAYGRLLQALRQAALTSPDLEVRDGSKVEAVDGSAAAARIRWRDREGRTHSRLTPLAVIADGGAHRDTTPALQWRYRQQALGCLVETVGAPGDLAWERFTPEGPLALLPTARGLGLIWTGPAARIGRLLAAPDAEFLAELQSWFGDRAGRFVRCSPRVAYPLVGRYQLQTESRRLLHVANAAQTLHPVAGQGFNLGLRDVRALVDCIALAPAGDPGAPAVLSRYRSSRNPDRQLTSGLTHALASGFTLPIPGLAMGAALGFGLLDSSTTLRRRFAHLMANGVAS